MRSGPSISPLASSGSLTVTASGMTTWSSPPAPGIPISLTPLGTGRARAQDPGRRWGDSPAHSSRLRRSGTAWETPDVRRGWRWTHRRRAGRGHRGDVPGTHCGRIFGGWTPGPPGSFCSKAGSGFCPAYPESLSRRAAHHLTRLGVEVRTEALVSAVDPEGVRVGDTTIRRFRGDLGRRQPGESAAAQPRRPPRPAGPGFRSSRIAASPDIPRSS